MGNPFLNGHIPPQMLDFPMEILQRVGQIHLKITASSIEQMRPGQLPRHTSGEAPF
jgi:hypothetical protein